MFSQELRDYITYGKEDAGVEYKASMKWTKKSKINKERVSTLQIVKAMLSLSNNTNGGVIVIGEKEKGNGEFIPTGVSKKVYDSFKYDDISRYLKGISNPRVQFKISRDEMKINGKKKKFVIIQIAESNEFPVICTRTELYDRTKGQYPDNVVLRENAIYIRAKAPVESREISSVREWRELIYRIMERSKRELLKRMPCSEFMKDKLKNGEKAKIKVVTGSPEFQQQLKNDKL